MPLRQLDIQPRRWREKETTIYTFVRLSRTCYERKRKKLVRTSFVEDCSREYSRRVQFTVRSRSMQTLASCSNDARWSVERLKRDVKPWVNVKCANFFAGNMETLGTKISHSRLTSRCWLEQTYLFELLFDHIGNVFESFFTLGIWYKHKIITCWM